MTSEINGALNDLFDSEISDVFHSVSGHLVVVNNLPVRHHEHTLRTVDKDSQYVKTICADMSLQLESVYKSIQNELRVRVIWLFV